MSVEHLVQENVWLDKSKYSDAERIYHEKQAQNTCQVPGKKVLLAEIEKARQILHDKVQNVNELESSNICPSNQTNNAIAELKNAFKNLEIRVSVLEGKTPCNTLSNSNSLNQDILQLQNLLKQLETRVTTLEANKSSTTMIKNKESPKKVEKDDDDDDVDLFASESEEESEEAAKIKAQRVAEYAARKSKKPTLVAKSNIILDVKPWDDETDMKELEKEVRKVTTDGLLWGASKLVPLAYGIHKLQISCVVEDEKVSIDWLQETLQEIEDYVQSVDIAAFNKI
ncbi:probable elongation factor 1-delta isoform X1 [Daktulosphaira vitifoliae]|uniref:probable elongation factor 1-delta isoform X1 n=1 Tax=Daktulosphaira vitifoliae TaxID=58002 RepID=UPI0021AAD36D|nr:probable elongation factor 1-delta isoform X1 [Daktulosphaira vitifoliae]